MDLWSFLWAVAAYFVLLHTGASARMRDFAEHLTSIRALQVGAYWVQFLVAVTVMMLPLTLYRDYAREHMYGLSNLTLSAWFGERGKGLAIAIILGGVAMMILYAVVRRLPRTWWLWGAVATVVFLAFLALIVPVAIEPVFNTPKKLADQRVVRPILSLARANGIGAHDVWEIDESKQSKRISAHVSGLFGTERITLNDNLLARCSLPEIEAVMGHEMGHYVLNHVHKLLLEFGVVTRLVPGTRGELQVVITNRRDARLFAHRVGFLGTKQSRLLRQLADIPVASRAFSSDHIPFLADFIRQHSGSGWTQRDWLTRHNIDRVERWPSGGAGCA